ncbi:MAG: hypothetical protein KL787_08100 [Taibaiella sp.]|nr:hypothetical protein [Taibaiella sp.]
MQLSDTKFLEKKEAEVRLSVFDLLNQNQAISRTFTEYLYPGFLEQYDDPVLYADLYLYTEKFQRKILRRRF